VNRVPSAGAAATDAAALAAALRRCELPPPPGAARMQIECKRIRLELRSHSQISCTVYFCVHANLDENR